MQSSGRTSRSECRDPKKELRLLWTKIVTSGVHSGDSLTVEEIARLQTELQVAQPLFEKDPVFRRFPKKLGDLVAASLQVGESPGF